MFKLIKRIKQLEERQELLSDSIVIMSHSIDVLAKNLDAITDILQYKKGELDDAK